MKIINSTTTEILPAGNSQNAHMVAVHGLQVPVGEGQAVALPAELNHIPRKEFASSAEFGHEMGIPGRKGVVRLALPLKVIHREAAHHIPPMGLAGLAGLGEPVCKAQVVPVNLRQGAGHLPLPIRALGRPPVGADILHDEPALPIQRRLLMGVRGMAPPLPGQQVHGQALHGPGVFEDKTSARSVRHQKAQARQFCAGIALLVRAHGFNLDGLNPAQAHFPGQRPGHAQKNFFHNNYPPPLAVFAEGIISSIHRPESPPFPGAFFVVYSIYQIRWEGT